MVLADTFGNVFLIASTVAVIVAVVGYWFLNRHAPRGVVLAVGIVAYVIGVVLAASAGDARLLVGLSGLLKMVGFVGFVLGLIGLIRKQGNATAVRQANISALQSGLVKPTGAKRRPTIPDK